MDSIDNHPAYLLTLLTFSVLTLTIFLGFCPSDTAHSEHNQVSYSPGMLSKSLPIHSTWNQSITQLSRTVFIQHSACSIAVFHKFVLIQELICCGISRLHYQLFCFYIQVHFRVTLTNTPTLHSNLI